MRSFTCQTVNMTDVCFRHLAKTLAKRKGPGLSGVLSACRAASGLSKDMLPGPYPKTAEERAAAAKKYNMTIEDYEPMPDNGKGYGDCPKLPDTSQHERDPWNHRDHPDLRRNWREQSHWDFDQDTRNHGDTSPFRMPWSFVCRHLPLYFGLMLFAIYIGEKYPQFQLTPPSEFQNILNLGRGEDPEKQLEEVKNNEI